MDRQVIEQTPFAKAPLRRESATVQPRHSGLDVSRLKETGWRARASRNQEISQAHAAKETELRTCKNLAWLKSLMLAGLLQDAGHFSNHAVSRKLAI